MSEPLPKHVLDHIAKMKSIFDGQTLNGWIQSPPAAIAFSGSDFVDVSAFVKRLSDPSDPVAAFLREGMADAAKKAVAEFSPSTEVKAFTSLLAKQLNSAVSSSLSIFTDERFSRVKLSDETKALRAKNPKGMHLARLNRLLLEDAFPRELARSDSSAWIVKDGAMASTGAGRGVIYTKDDYTHYRLVFQVRQTVGNHVPDILIFGQRPAEGERGLDALGAIQFQAPNGGHWDYRPGVNKGGAHFTRPVRIRLDYKEWCQVEMLVNAKTGTARMAVAQPVGMKGTVNLLFNDPEAGRTGPIAWQMHNAGIFDEFRDVRVEIDPKDDKLITAEY